MAISTLSKPQRLNCLNSLVLALEKGEVNRKVLIPYLIMTASMFGEDPMKVNLSRFLKTVQFNRRPEPHESFQFALAGAVQSISVARVIILGPVGRQFIAAAALWRDKSAGVWGFQILACLPGRNS